MKKKDLKIIRQINKEAWDLYGKDLIEERDVAPDVKKVVELSLTKERHLFTDEQIENMETFRDMGVLDMRERVTNEEVERKFNEYTQKRLVEEIEKGRLSNPKTDPYFKKLNQDANRIKKGGDTGAN